MYYFISLNLSKDTQKQSSTGAIGDKILRLLYIFNFYLFFIPVTDTLSTIFKCYGGGNLFVGRQYPMCNSNSLTFLPISLIVLIIKIAINILHEVCDIEKKIKFSKKWSK